MVHELDRGRARSALRAQIGYVFQFAALFDSMTVADNIRLGLARRGLDADEIARPGRARACALVDLPGAEERFPAELSGGMRKRVGIARAIALRPRYILYDEPTTGLDPVTSAVIDELMVRTRQELGVTGVVVTHDMRSAYTVGDRIAMLYQGRIRQVGTIEEIRHTDDPVVRQFIEGRPDLDRRPIRGRRHEAGQRIPGRPGAARGARRRWSAARSGCRETNIGRREAVHVARFRTVGGLSPGRAGHPPGVRVGRVEAIRLADEFGRGRPPGLSGGRAARQPAVIAASQSLFGEWSATIVSGDQPQDDPNVRPDAGRDRADPAATPGPVPPCRTSASSPPRPAGSPPTSPRSPTGAGAPSTPARSPSSGRASRTSATITDQLVRFTQSQTRRLNQVTGNVDPPRERCWARQRRPARPRPGPGRLRHRRGPAAGDRRTTRRPAPATSRAPRPTSRACRRRPGARRPTWSAVLQAADSVLGRIQNGQGTLGLLSKDRHVQRDHRDDAGAAAR